MLDDIKAQIIEEMSDDTEFKDYYQSYVKSIQDDIIQSEVSSRTSSITSIFKLNSIEIGINSIVDALKSL